jgi:uncharacterized protein
LKRSYASRCRRVVEQLWWSACLTALLGCTTPVKPSPAEPVETSAPAPATPKLHAYEEVELRFMSGADELAGTLSIPRGVVGLAPAVLLLQDAGPMDRDATQRGELGVQWAQPVSPHRELAQGLAQRGFVVLRYDKRTCVKGMGRCGYPASMASGAVSKLEEDAGAALRALAARPEVDPKRLGVVGHGEGAELALLLSERVRAMVLLAPSPYPIEALIHHQHAMSVARLEQQLAREPDSAQADLWRQQLAALREAQGEETSFEALRRGEAVEQVFGLPAQSWRTRWERHDRAMKRLETQTRLLAIFGDRDEVLPMEAARVFAKRAPTSVGERGVRVVTGITHGMIEAERGDGLGSEVTQLVADGLRRQLADSHSDN